MLITIVYLLNCFQIGNKCDALASTSETMFRDEATMEAFCKEKGFAGYNQTLLANPYPKFLGLT